MHTLPYEIDCTICGCADCEVLREPQPEGWFADGLARCSECGQDFAFRAGKEDETEDGRQETETRSVAYMPLRCPYCGSADVPVQRSVLPVRYHRCRRCRRSFKSVEKRVGSC